MRSPFPLYVVAPAARPAPLPKVLGKLPTMPSEELEILADEEASERSGPMTELGLERSRQRRLHVARLLYEGAARTSDDYVHAAFIFQFGDSVAELERANALANRALAFRDVHPQARWLAASTDDQLRMLRGEAQRFGTQVCFQGEKWALYRVDPRVTDAERAVWDVPPLATAFEYVARVNDQRNA
jgi:hypothetical protein